jgi:hypothetical protein
MPETRYSMLLSDARQMSPLPASALLPHRSVCPPDLDLRQVPRALERRGHELQPLSNLGSRRRPWCRTGALRRVPRPRFKAPAAVGGTLPMKDLLRRRTAHRRVRPDLVVPALEPRQGSAETAVLERHHFVCKTFFFEGADEPLLHGDAAMPSNRAEPGANVVVPIALSRKAHAVNGAIDGKTPHVGEHEVGERDDVERGSLGVFGPRLGQRDREWGARHGGRAEHGAALVEG